MFAFIVRRLAQAVLVLVTVAFIAFMLSQYEDDPVVLNIRKELQRRQPLTYLFISHNLAVVRHVSDQVGVMYLGRLVELSDKHTLFDNPRHPYTRMLLDAIPKMHATGRARTPVSGEVPNPLNPPTGCAFHPRRPFANGRGKSERPQMLLINSAQVACHAVAEGRI